MTILTFLLALTLPQDLGPWIERLKSDDTRERDAASRHLQSLGATSMAALEAVKTDDPEVQARLQEIIGVIRTRIELTKVFGPTRRSTLSCRQQKLGDLIPELGRALGEEIGSKGVDLGKPVDLELKDATLWQALDALAAAAGLHYEYADKVTLLPGAGNALPVKYLEQFRLSIGEIKKIDYRTVGESAGLGSVAIFLRYQNNLKPAGPSFSDVITIESVRDAAGKDLEVDLPPWGSSWSSTGRPQTFSRFLFVAGDARPMTIEGKARVLFKLKRREVSIPLEEGKREAAAGDVRFQVSGFGETAATTLAKVHISSEETKDLSSRLCEDEVDLVDAQGKRHRGTYRGGGGATGFMTREFEFPRGIEKPQRILIPWTTEFHLVEFPFRFENVRLP